jgi:hypothetical protein
MRQKKQLIEMTPQELREEIGKLETTLTRVVTKNKRRRTALKQLNTHALVTFKMMSDLLGQNRHLTMETQMLREQVNFLRQQMTIHKPQQVHQEVMQECGPKVEVQNTRRWFNFGKGVKGVSGA